jgi:hypothetical protein
MKKEEVFEVLVRLGYLKSASQNSISIFVARENMF